MALALVLLLLAGLPPALLSPDAKRLYGQLVGGYNRLLRPVGNNSETLTVLLGMRLSQLIDVDERNQIMTTNVWLKHVWFDNRLRWEPTDYGGIITLEVPSDKLWLPDIVLYNNADGKYEVTLMTKATLHPSGMIVWEPPAIYKSSCTINVEWFPFDEQVCTMKFGSWTYDGYQVNLQHTEATPGHHLVPLGIDLKGFVRSVEWDIMAVPARKNEVFYTCCPEPYPDITFNITLRRKTLFYTVNLITPVVSISFLTAFVFYLPSESGEKVTLCISILLALTVYFLLLIEIIPPTSLVVPLIGKYLIFTMALVTLSVVTTIGVLNLHFRNPHTHEMPQWVRVVFLHYLPNVLHIGQPPIRKPSKAPPPKEHVEARTSIEKAALAVGQIAEGLRREDVFAAKAEEWKFVARVLDRLFLYVFTAACLGGSGIFFLQAPTLYDHRQPVDQLMAARP